MQVTWLGWAGVEVEAQGARLVVDLLGDPHGVVAALGEAGDAIPLPEVAPAARGESVVGLVTHLHRDHTDAGALAEALVPGAPVLHPPHGGGDDHENFWVLQGDSEIDQQALPRMAVDTWETHTFGPFRVTALPAVDSVGDPQVSWLIEADGTRIVHLGDSMFHGYWWRMKRRHGPFDLALLPINGATVCLPHAQPPSTLPAALDPTQAALAGHILEVPRVVPIHYGGFESDPYYHEVPRSLEVFSGAAEQYSYEVIPLEPGQAYDE